MKKIAIIILKINKEQKQDKMKTHGFTAENWKHQAMSTARPWITWAIKKEKKYLPEDAYQFDEKKGLAVVADGITPDLTDGRAEVPTLKGGWDILWHHPDPDPARLAAVRVAYGAIERLRDIDEGNRTADTLKEVMLDTNAKDLVSLRLRLGLTPSTVNYRERDYPGCEAAITALQKQDGQYRLNGCFIGDCFIALCDSSGKLRYITPDEGPSRYEEIVSAVLDEELEKLEKIGKLEETNLGWENSLRRAVIRSWYRNNPTEPFSYGALTGEPTMKIEPYIRTFERDDIKPGDTILTLTDGAESVLFKKDRKSPLGKITKPKVASLIEKCDFKGIERLCQKETPSEGAAVIGRVEK